ncbi:hypothetical protein [Richelia intracellularis]|uniref:hypothetical protein n=1 Tax=Richelia intracellularis TaxID=1164990 RepID=UPI0005C7BB5A|nr:hypothetical protein [Richelia intracellularis]HAE06423.1 hypothetical protein [Richelia sp.]
MAGNRSDHYLISQASQMTKKVTKYVKKQYHDLTFTNMFSRSEQNKIMVICMQKLGESNVGMNLSNSFHDYFNSEFKINPNGHLQNHKRISDRTCDPDIIL